MKKLIYVNLVIEAVACLISFIAILGRSVVVALLVAPILPIGLVISIAILKMMETQEHMKNELIMLRTNVRQMERVMNLSEDIEYHTALSDGENAFGTWECVKCGSVNKLGSAYCENCKSAYSSEINPTADPNKKKKTNRWGI